MVDNKLKVIIESKFDTVYNFLQVSKLPSTYVYQLVKGEANPTVKQIKKLAEHLGMDETELYNAIRND